MKILGNIIWVVFGGLIGAVGWGAAGLMLLITIVGIPFGIQCMKIAALTLWPFGHDVTIGEFGAMGLIGNVLWIMLFGWELLLYHLGCALLFAVTIIGIPFARQHLKLARLAFIPFGAEIR